MTRVLVTGAGGKTGRAVLDAVTRRGASVRAFVRDATKVDDLDVEVAVGDQRRVEDLVAAMTGVDGADGTVGVDGADGTAGVGGADGTAGGADGNAGLGGAGAVDAVYAIAPNVSPHEVEMTAAVIEACRRVGVDRLVLHSVVHPQLTSMPHHTDKARSEELLIGSGLAWTILQPNAYLQNIGGADVALRAGAYPVPYDVDARLALVDLADIASVAAAALVDGLGVHATFELSGPAEVSGRDIARIAGEVLGREVTAEQVPLERWAADNAELPEHARDRLLAMFGEYDRHGSPGDATVLTAVLGRPAGDLRGYLAELLA